MQIAKLLSTIHSEKIPVLELDDGSTLYDSSVIVDYLDTVTPVSRLIPEPTQAARASQALGSFSGWRFGSGGQYFSGAQAPARPTES